MMQCSTSDNWSDRLCAILLLFSLSSHITHLFDTPQLNSLLLSGLHDPHPEVVSISVKACKSILTSLVLELNYQMIDSEGKIVAKNLRGEALYEKIAELLQ